MHAFETPVSVCSLRSHKKKNSQNVTQNKMEDMLCISPPFLLGSRLEVNVQLRTARTKWIHPGTHPLHDQVFSEVELTEGVGAYRLAVNFSSVEQSTKCLYWDSSAEDVETALELLGNVDSVHVERDGSGTEGDRWVWRFFLLFPSFSLFPSLVR